MFYSTEETEQKKQEFARNLLLTPTDPYAAALRTDPRANFAIWITNTWQYDSEVQAHMKVLRDEHKSRAALPTKEEFAEMVIIDAKDTRNSSTRLELYKLFASVMGYIEKPAQTVVNNNTVVDNRKVIALPEHKTIDNWESEAVTQQMKLVNGTA